MPWPWLTIVASNIPWVELARRAPGIVDDARRLLAKSRKLEHHAQSTAPASASELHDRIAVLENREVEQARVVEQMARQLEGLTVSVEVLAARNKVLIYVVVVLAVAMLLMFVAR